MSRTPVVTLTSDFGQGVFVGLMKGVILGICPEARLVDLSHEVAPQDVFAGSLVMCQALDVFGPPTIHLAVVDPGVGTGRRAIVVQALGMFFVGPDNGLFTPVFRADPDWKAFELTNRRFFRSIVSATFHGRDIFAPVAAHLALGASPNEMGPPVSDLVRLESAAPVIENGVLKGQVLQADSFGNITTNLHRDKVAGFLAGRPAKVKIGDLSVRGLSQAYGDAEPGALLALFNSMELLEIAKVQGDVCQDLAMSRGDAVGMEVVVEAEE